MSELRADVAADDNSEHWHAMSLPISEVVRRLVDVLGLSLVANVGGVNETRAVRQWMADREPQRPQTLRFALQLATMIQRGNDHSIVRSWFQGSNPHLGDESPAAYLRNNPLSEAQIPLMAAARAFRE